MKLRIIGATVATLFALSGVSSTALAGDKDCSDFRTWRAAQKFYKRHGGPQRDPHRLDADDDGIACESLRY
jgi:competence protein ComEC